MRGLKTALYLLIILSCTAGGVYLIHDYFAAQPPDLNTASPDELIAFMLSPYFNRLSPEDQRYYTEQAMKRYAKMDDDQRKIVEDRIAQMKKDHPEELRDQAMRVWKQFVVSEAEQYVQLPPDQRAAWLDGRIAVWKAMGAGDEKRNGETDEQRKKREEERKAPFDAAKQQKVIQFFQTDVLPKTTARERALVMALAKDAVRKMKPK
ncbi:MAG: hypothetical protein GC162_09855 [Planctomycetes bacterium]|nr:hypothetical protein [Planctomycetota bacterium]